MADNPSISSPMIGYLMCDCCGVEIDFNDPGIELFVGKVGYGPKSRRPMVIDDINVDNPYASLHLECVQEYISKFVLDEDQTRCCEACGTPIELCTSCGEKLKGD